jgi:hypothetical protein
VSAGALLRLSPQASVAELRGESVVLHLKSGRFYSVNGVGTLLLTLLKSGATRSRLVDSVVSAYAVPAATAAADVDAWLARLREGGLLVEAAPDA